ncbi:flagellar hook-associated protein FlgK [Paracraurococcus ruber]|uniref:Flagellar hook-associated protein 1 n=1 Tax=Paracraurococcus ruber TaxID=77675 RepID=A0ABS1CZI4_9PROT|nr:flagellar hook-associated protein FlgK [Paracraurococcus ruber]MBK1659948.1 flagellar hook-associated protein FlgK [Paracraurococcus ruber]TDG28844.1 flagellar hook-associated protein FlgK [Paracraurococcus ruber]
MTIQGALLTALSSLAAEQRQAAVIANNVANANTAGYVRRALPRSEQLTGGQGTGVDTQATQRLGDEVLAAAARASGADAAYGQRMADMLAQFTTAVGQPSDARSLSTAIGNFRAALTALSASPDNAVAQNSAVESAKSLVDAFHRMDRAVSDARTAADLAVSRDVDAVNTALGRLVQVDQEMAKADARGDSLAEYQDQRDLLLADISKSVPVTIHDGGPGRLVLTTDKGQTLYDSGTVHRLSFTGTPAIPSEIRAATGGLSGVTVDGTRLRSSSSGSVAAGLKLRDDTLPRYADMLDQIAGNLMQASQQADPTVSGTAAAGLFSTNGSASLGPLYPTAGLARTIGLNPKADPDQATGLVSRIRDGMGSTGTGNAADNSGILALLGAMETSRPYSPLTGLSASLSLADAAAQSAGLMQADRSSWADRAQTRQALDLQAQQNLTNKTSVNVDEELQRLLLVQQTHSASVQVIQTASHMLDDLIGLRS